MADTNPKIFPQEAKPIAELKEKETIASLDSLSPKQTKENKTVKKSKIRRKNSIRPIILLLTFFLFFGFSQVEAQINGSVKIGAVYSDNVFHLSEYDIDRFDDHHPNLNFVDTIDDLTLNTRIVTPINAAVVEGYYKQIKQLSDSLDIPMPSDWFKVLLRMPDVS